MEKNYEENMSEDSAIKLAMKALLEIVESGSKNLEVVVVGHGGAVQTVSDEKIEAFCTAIEAEKEAAKSGGESKSS